MRSHLMTRLLRAGSRHIYLVRSRYGPTLEDMYDQIEQRQRERQDEMRAAAAQGTILDKVKQARLSAQFLRPLSLNITHAIGAHDSRRKS